MVTLFRYTLVLSYLHTAFKQTQNVLCSYEISTNGLQVSKELKVVPYEITVMLVVENGQQVSQASSFVHQGRYL